MIRGFYVKRVHVVMKVACCNELVHCLVFMSDADVLSHGRVLTCCCRLTLVWYHTTVRPFFALDGTNFSAGLSHVVCYLFTFY